MLRAAPPDGIEQAHEEALAKLTPEQRRLTLEQLSAAIPQDERADQQCDDLWSPARKVGKEYVYDWLL